MLDEINENIKKGEINKALNLLLHEVEVSTSISKETKSSIESVLLQNISRLSIINKERMLGIITSEAYSSEHSKLNFNVIRLVSMVRNQNFDELEMVSVVNNAIRQRNVKEANFLDKVFKSLLLMLLFISILLLGRTLILSQINIQERLLQASISMVGGFGSFLGYFRWRLTELK